MTLAQFRRMIIAAVKHAFKLNLEVMVVLEDAGRAGSGVENETIAGLHKIGVNSFIIAESVGALTPPADAKENRGLDHNLSNR